MSFDQNENSRMHRERRRAEGRCLYCGKPLDHEGRVACTKCTRKKVAARRSVRLERQANGLCVVCGKTRASVGYITCAACRERSKEANRRSRAKMRKKRGGDA